MIRGITTTAFVPPKLDGRIVIIKVENGREADRLSYFTDVVLGADTEQNGLRVKQKHNLIIAENSGNPLFPHERFITAFSGEILEFSDTDVRSRSINCISAEYALADTAVLLSGFSDEEQAIEYLDLQRAEQELEETKKHWREQSARF